MRAVTTKRQSLSTSCVVMLHGQPQSTSSMQSCCLVTTQRRRQPISFKTALLYCHDARQPQSTSFSTIFLYGLATQTAPVNVIQCNFLHGHDTKTTPVNLIQYIPLHGHDKTTAPSRPHSVQSFCVATVRGQPQPTSSRTIFLYCHETKAISANLIQCNLFVLPWCKNNPSQPRSAQCFCMAMIQRQAQPTSFSTIFLYGRRYGNLCPWPVFAKDCARGRCLFKIVVAVAGRERL